MLLAETVADLAEQSAHIHAAADVYTAAGDLDRQDRAVHPAADLLPERSVPDRQVVRGRAAGVGEKPADDQVVIGVHRQGGYPRRPGGDGNPAAHIPPGGPVPHGQVVHRDTAGSDDLAADIDVAKLSRTMAYTVPLIAGLVKAGFPTGIRGN